MIKPLGTVSSIASNVLRLKAGCVNIRIIAHYFRKPSPAMRPVPFAVILRIQKAFAPLTTMSSFVRWIPSRRTPSLNSRVSCLKGLETSKCTPSAPFPTWPMTYAVSAIQFMISNFMRTRLIRLLRLVRWNITIKSAWIRHNGNITSAITWFTRPRIRNMKMRHFWRSNLII